MTDKTEPAATAQTPEVQTASAEASPVPVAEPVTHEQHVARFLARAIENGHNIQKGL